MNKEKHIRIVEVGPRDGLQNEAKILDLDTKVKLIRDLSRTGLSVIEVGSFVSPVWVPQMANSDDVFLSIDHSTRNRFPILVPNQRGLEKAIELGVKEISCFTSISDTFNQKNINCSVDESLSNIKVIVERASASNILVRAYVSCIAGCPYEGDTELSRLAEVSDSLLSMGCYEVSLGDTIGVSSPGKMSELLAFLLTRFDKEKLALHLHDTYGQALANIYVALQSGIRTFDSAVAGLGGCPYAKGASGNVATEDLVYMLNGLGYTTGVDLEKLVEVGDRISQTLGRQNQSKVGRAMIAKSR